MSYCSEDLALCVEANPRCLSHAVHSGSDIYGFDRRWVTVFGFRPGDEARVLRTFQELFGTVINQRLTSRNYMHMQFETEEAALEAIGSNGQLHSGDMLGVVFCTDRVSTSVEEMIGDVANRLGA